MSMKLGVFHGGGFALFALSWIQGCTVSAGSAPEDGVATAENVAQATEALPSAPQAFRLRNFAKDGKCMGVKAALDNEWTPFIIWSCLDTANQKFRKDTSINDGEFFRLADLVAANRCVYAYGRDRAYNATCYDASAERWKQRDTFTDSAGRECFKLENKGYPNQVLSVLGGKVQDNAYVGIWDISAGTADQIWCAEPIGSP